MVVMEWTESHVLATLGPQCNVLANQGHQVGGLTDSFNFISRCHSQCLTTQYPPRDLLPPAAQCPKAQGGAKPWILLAHRTLKCKNSAKKDKSTIAQLHYLD